MLLTASRHVPCPGRNVDTGAVMMMSGAIVSRRGNPRSYGTHHPRREGRRARVPSPHCAPFGRLCGVTGMSSLRDTEVRFAICDLRKRSMVFGLKSRIRSQIANRKSQKKSARARRFFSIFASNKFLLTRNIKQPLLKLSLMKKYVCKVCGHVYDPAEGDPDNGIAPGTAFEDLPDNWSCPICGVGKEDFEPEA